MAAFDYKGNTYFFVNGRWTDACSRKITAELSDELSMLFSEKDIWEKENKVKAVVKKKNYQNLQNMQSYKVNNWLGDKPKHKCATQTNYERTVQLTKEQERALAELESGKNVFLSGEAGTGKSFVLNEYIYKNKNKNIIICAPTGIAAISIGGSTLHRVFNIPISISKPGDFNKNPDSSLKKADVIIIDEISMCRLDVFEYVIRTIQNTEEGKPKQIIVVGDFFQLAPVITTNAKEILSSYWDMDLFGEGYAFQSRLWAELDFKNIILKEIMRQQDSVDYVENLNRIRKGDKDAIPWFNAHIKKDFIQNNIYLCGTNKSADVINVKESDALDGETVVYTAQIEGEVQPSDKLTQDSLELKVGMQVMTLVNNSEEGYQNGSIGKITDLGNNSIKVRLNTGKNVIVGPYEWEILGYEVQEEKLEKVVLGKFKQIPLKIAYAITIHKSQGQTYTNANISPNCFAEGQLYVALSRVRTIEGMRLEHDIKEHSLKTSEAVKKFYAAID